VNLLLISDFNLQTLAQYLRYQEAPPKLSVTVVPYGQVVPALLASGDASAKDTVAVVWTTPQKIAPAFHQACCYQRIVEQALFAEVQQFADCLRQARDNFRNLLVVSWTLPPQQRGWGMLDLQERGLRKLLMKMNLKLMEELDAVSGVYVLDAQRWLEMVGKHAYSSKLWYLTKNPFHCDVLKVAAQDLRAALAALDGQTRKLVVVDLDDTLWGGVVGEVGWQNITLGGHDHLGEAFVDFQRALKSLTNRGIVLGIVSKNEEDIALEAIANHPEMVLRLQDFAAWRINRKDKARNIADLAAELNLGLQSVVFIDDTPLERARVREALPEVLVPEWAEDKTLYATQLLQMDCFDSAYLTSEDVNRTHSYLANRQREQLKKTVGSVEEWLRSLQTRVIVEELNDVNRPRTLQLLNKTNQMNLSTRRLSDRELRDWGAKDGRRMWTFRVRDRLEDAGLTGIVSLEAENGVARIVDFVLSCRVMDRNIEHAMLALAVQQARDSGFRRLEAHFVPTTKNKACLDFWKNSGFAWNEAGRTFTWLLDASYPFPDGITLEWKIGAASKGISGLVQESSTAFASTS
jgi:FkbH-like protein